MVYGLTLTAIFSHKLAAVSAVDTILALDFNSALDLNIGRAMAAYAIAKVFKHSVMTMVFMSGFGDVVMRPLVTNYRHYVFS
jgi:hypothetical protein